MFVLFALSTMHLARPSAARARKVARAGPTACKFPRRFCDVGFPRHCRLQTPIPWQGGGFCQEYIAAYRLDCAHLPACCFSHTPPKHPLIQLSHQVASTCSSIHSQTPLASPSHPLHSPLTALHPPPQFSFQRSFAQSVGSHMSPVCKRVRSSHATGCHACL